MTDHSSHVRLWQLHQVRADLERRGLWLPKSKRPWVRGSDVAETFKRVRAKADKKLRVA